MEKTNAPNADDVQKMAAIADFIVADGTAKTYGGHWITDFTDIPQNIADPDFIESHADAIFDKLCEREEILDIEQDGGSFNIVYGLAFCPNLESAESVDDGVAIDTTASRKLTENAVPEKAQAECKPSILETLKINAEKSRQQAKPKQDGKKSKEMEM